MFRESLYSGLWPMAVVLLVLALPLQGHAGDEIRPLYEIRDAEVPDLHDGSLADWQRLFPEPALTEKDFFQAIEAQDLRVNIYLGWSGTYNRLYMAVERLDDVYVFSSTNTTFAAVRCRQELPPRAGQDRISPGRVHSIILMGRYSHVALGGDS